MDNLSQLSKDIRQMRLNGDNSLRRYHAEKPRIEHARDIFDSIVPFEMPFTTYEHDGGTRMSLAFSPPPNTCCCTQCYCAQCDFFTGTTDAALTTTHIIFGDTAHVFFNDVEITTWTKTSSTEITLDFAPLETDQIKICYTYEIPFFGAVDCTQEPGIEITQVFDTRHPEVIIGEIGTGGSIFGWAGGLLFSTPNIKVAHATIEGWFGAPMDTPTDEYQVSDPLNLIDGNEGTCSGVPQLVLRLHTDQSPDPEGVVYVRYDVVFNQLVRVCKLRIVGDQPQGVFLLTSIDFENSVFVYSPDGTAQINSTGGAWEIIPTQGIDCWGISFFVNALTVGNAPGDTHPGPFNLFFYAGANECEIEVSAISASCISQLVAGQV